MKKLRHILLFTLLIGFKPFTALGATYYWTGLINNDWTNGLNWINLAPPTASDDVIIQPFLNFVTIISPPNYPIITTGQNVSCASIIVQNVINAPSITINSGGKLTVTNTNITFINVASGAITAAGTLVLSGVNGSILFTTVTAASLTVGGTLSLTGTTGNITFDKTPTATFTVNGTSSQTGAIIQTYNTTSNVALAITGTGSINCNTLNIGDNATVPATATTYTATTKSNIKTLTVSGAITVTSTGGTSKTSNPIFNIDNDNVDCTVTAASLNTVNVTPSSTSFAAINLYKDGTKAIDLRLTGATPISIASSTYGAIDFYPSTAPAGTGTSNTTVEYAGTANQTVYTNSTAGLNATPSVYQHIKFSGAFIKTINSGSLTIDGNWDSAGGNIVATGTTVTFQGAAETLTDAGSNSGAGVLFKIVNFQGSGTKSIAGSSIFSVSGQGILTMAGTAILDVGTSATLKLLSDATGTATVAAIVLPCKITGNVSAQRFIKAGTILGNARNYRALSSPVNANSIIDNTGATAYYNLASLNAASGVFTGGPGGPTSGFTVTNASPTLYLYKETLPASNTTFNSGNFKGMANIAGASTVSVYNDAGTTPYVNATLYAGNAFLLFYAGNNINNVSSTTALNKQFRVGGNYIDPDASTITITGALNQGNVPVKLWWSSTTSLTKTQTGFHLVGNPYASTIDWEKFSNSSSSAAIYGPNVGTTVYVFNYVNKNYGTYQVGGASTNNGTRYIASGQGFFIKASVAGATLTFTEAAKTNTQPTLPLVFMGLPAQIAQAPQILRIKLTKDSINTDETALVFSNDAQNSFEDGVDAYRLNGIGNVSTIASYAADVSQQLAINHLHSIDSTTRVKLYVNSTGAAAINTLSITGFSNLDPRYDAFLIDHYKKDSLQISTYGSYDFNLDPANAATFGDSRFELVFHKKSGLNYRLLSFTGSALNGNVQLKWTTQFEQNLTSFTLEKADAAGNYNQIYAIQSTGAGSYTWLDKSPVAGLNTYRLKQNDAFDHITYSNLVNVDLTPSGDAIPPIMVYPNPAVAQFNLKVTVPTVPNQMLMRVIGLNGQTYISKVWSGSNNTQQNVSALLPGTYVVEVTDNATKQLIGRVKISKP